jgi:uncharacterized membrane protein YhdT
MSIYNLPNQTRGMDETLVEVIATVGAFIPGLLLFVFGFILITGLFAQKKRTGYADMPMWLTMASFSTLLVTLILTMKEGLVNLTTLGIVISITLFSGLWLFLSRGRGEI